jgi:hypothetical protein
LEEGEQENVALAVFKSLGAIVNPEDPIFDPLKEYIQFCGTYRSQESFEHLSENWVESPLGGFSGALASVWHFIAMFRYDGRVPGPEHVKRNTKRCKSKFWELRKAMLASVRFDESKLPSSLLQPLGSNAWTHDLLTRWAFEKPKKAAIVQGSLKKEHIQSWCLWVLGLHMVDPPQNIRTLVLYALLLRIQSGTNGRHTNVASILWSDVGIDVAGCPWIDFTNTKAFKLASSCNQEKLQPKGIVQCLDVISMRLFKIWWDWHLPKHEPSREARYVFPRVNVGHFNFLQHLTNENHKEACQLAAVHCDLILPHTGHLDTFTSQAIRRGNACHTYLLVKSILGHTNPLEGRRQASFLFAHYAGEGALVAPGPLFSDVDGIRLAYNEFFFEHLLQHKNSLLCPSCGFPACKCTTCKKGKHAHTCYIKYCYDMFGCCKPTASGHRYDEFVINEWRAQWALHGVDTLPVWDKADKTRGKLGSYVWPDTTPEELPNE